jgi:hypothetical protein
MKTQAFKAMEKLKDENPITKLWCQLVTNSLLIVHLFEFMKLVELAIIQIIGSVKDESTFSTLTFMKFKLWNCLAGHLNIVICMFAQDFFTKDSFPFHATITNWNDENKVRVGIDA